MSIFIISYWRSKTDKVSESDYSESRLLTKKGRARSLRPLDEFFIVMCRLRQGFPEDHLAQLFNVSASTVSRIFITWVNFMFFKFGQINIWLSGKVIDTLLTLYCTHKKMASDDNLFSFIFYVNSINTSEKCYISFERGQNKLCRIKYLPSKLHVF